MPSLTPVGRLRKVPLRKVWPNEAQDFTAWLSENLDRLSEALGQDLSLVEREADVGPFAADLFAEDRYGNTAVIECQYEKTDHDHLGKVLTYLVNLDAKTAVWIVEDPRPEHVKVVNWLNEITPEDVSIYLVKIQLYSVDDSLPAPQFLVVAGPSEEGKAAGKTREKLAERHQLRYEFWSQLLPKAKEKTKTHANISPSKEGWVAASAGKPGLQYMYAILKDAASVELYIDRGSQEENKALFDALYAKKGEIEAAYGGTLNWERLDDKRASRIRAWVSDKGLRDRDSWPEIQAAMIDGMVKLSAALKKPLHELLSAGAGQG
ncbi:MAG: DUF4268 domain-containing protein [Anaerolineae bacterium]